MTSPAHKLSLLPMAAMLSVTVANPPIVHARSGDATVSQTKQVRGAARSGGTRARNTRVTSTSRSSINHGGRNRDRTWDHNANVDRNVRVDRDVDRDVRVDRDVDIDRDIDIDIDRDVDVDIDVRRDWHPVATAALVTAAVVGTRVYRLPPDCEFVYVGGYTYYFCDSIWYQPEYYGTNVTYIVVEAPD